MVFEKQQQLQRMQFNGKWKGNHIGTEGSIKIIESLKINTKFTELNMSCN